MPKLSPYNFICLDVLKAMKKVPTVKKELNKKESKFKYQTYSDEEDEGSDIFSDFFGGSSKK